MPDLEDVIRNHLAANLDLLEDGLTLVQKELLLKNPHGARGYPDIVARDKFGHFLIIEVKRSDAAARTALHELHKYAALFRISHGVSVTKIRCVLVSTEWHELLVPFSDYTRSADYHVEGYKIILNSDNTISRLEPVTILPEAPALHLCPHHAVLFVNEHRLPVDKIVRSVVTTFGDLNIANYVIAILHQEKSALDVPLWAVYVAVGAFSLQELDKLRGQAETDFQQIEELEPDSDSFRWYWEDWALEKINRIECDSVEIGYPEKFMHMMSKWDIEKIIRGGKFASSAIRSDELLIDALSGAGGENHIFFTDIANSQFSESWHSTTEAARRALSFNDEWTTVYFNLVREVGRVSGSTLAAVIFNPLNIIFVLRGLYRGYPTTVAPRLDVVCESGRDGPISFAFGQLEWDGVTFPSDPSKIIREAVELAKNSLESGESDSVNNGEEYDFASDFLLRANFQTLYELEPYLTAAHGLKYSVHIFTHEKPPSVESKTLNILDFMEHNAEYLAKLDELLDPFVR